MQRTRRFEFGTFIVVLVVVCGSLVACGGSKASSNGTTDAAIDGSGGADSADASIQSPDADGFVGGFDVSGPDTAMEDATSDTATLPRAVRLTNAARAASTDRTHPQGDWA